MKNENAIEVTTKTFKEAVDAYASMCLVSKIKKGDTTETIRGIIYDDENTESFNQIIKIVEKSRVGAIVYGNPGGGKTLIFELLQRIIPPWDKRGFAIIETIDVAKAFGNVKIGWNVFHRYQDKNVMFNDLGFEPKGKFYKETCETMEHFIYLREKLLDRNGIKTYFTTNLTEDEILQRYGQRTASRLKKMCHEVYLCADEIYTDRRPLKNLIRFAEITHTRPQSQEEIDFDLKYKAAREEATRTPYVNKTGVVGSHTKELREKLHVPAHAIGECSYDAIRVKINKILELVVTHQEYDDLMKKLQILYRMGSNELTLKKLKDTLTEDITFASISQQPGDLELKIMEIIR